MTKTKSAKKGQITILLIAAIVILLAAGFGYYAFTKLRSSDSGTPKAVSESNQVQSFTEHCMEQATESVFNTIGEQGGYYDPVTDGLVPIPLAPTEGPAFEPFSGTVAPYWSYLATPNTCKSGCAYASNEPELEGNRFPAIQYQAQNAIRQETLSCLDGYSSLSDQYTVTPVGDAVVTVAFSERSVSTFLTYPLTVEHAGVKSTLSNFQTTSDIPIKHLYDVADKIRNLSDNTGAFENMALETLTLESSGDKPAIPPPNGGLDLSFDPGPYWTIPQIRAPIAEALQRTMSLVQIIGSKDMDFVSTGNYSSDVLYQKYQLDITPPPTDVEVSFFYNAEWTPYIAVHPGSQLIKPETMTTGVPFIPSIKRMDFQYDLSYPVLVRLRAKRQSAEHDSYLFEFPIEVNLRNNNPTSFTPVVAQEALASVCDPERANGAPVKVLVKDQDGKALDAPVHFECISASCALPEAAHGTVDAVLPACAPGYLIAEKEGYADAETEVDSTGKDPQTITLTLQKLTKTTINFEPVLLTKASGDWALAGSTSLASNQRIILTVTGVGNNFGQSLIYPPEAPLSEDTAPATTMDLAPGDYEVHAFVLEKLTEPLVLEGGKKCSLLGLDCVTIPDVTLGSGQIDNGDGTTTPVDDSEIPMGGLTWDDATAQLRITQNDLVSGAITMPVIIIDKNSLKKVEDLDALSKIDEFSVDHGLSIAIPPVQ